VSRYYDRKGKPLTLDEFINLFGKDRVSERKYKILKQETLKTGYWVSTVWLGLDHSFERGPPLIFETMVFESKDHSSDLDCARYATEEEAFAGHAEMVKRWNDPVKDAKRRLAGEEHSEDES
jgi:hypothetical protein